MLCSAEKSWAVALRKESVDRNSLPLVLILLKIGSLSARRAWIEMGLSWCIRSCLWVALRKESVDRNSTYVTRLPRAQVVALRKESVDRNFDKITSVSSGLVALRKESVDRNILLVLSFRLKLTSLSARRAWIEIDFDCSQYLD